jgi:hypothetical protein
MTIKSLLSENKTDMLDRWFQLILETYPSDTSFFLKKNGQFANPLGATLSREIEAIFDQLVAGVDADAVSPSLDSIVRIRAVQEFAPSQAISFVFSLKQAVREVLELQIQEMRMSSELAQFESEIDALALLTFDIYVKCREQLFELKTDELKRQTHKLLERANRML